MDDDHDTPVPDHAPARRWRWDVVGLVASVVMLVGALVFLGLTLTGRGEADGRDAVVEEGDDGGITYVIPAGTKARLRAGEELEVIPQRIEVKVGQRLSVRNEDVTAYVLGPFFVGPGETSTYEFSSADLIAGLCELHPSGSFEIVVTE
jgi:hypothetical protein